MTGRVAAVTGAASGIGAAACRRLASDGAAIAAIDYDAAGAESVVRALTNSGAQAIAIAADVTDPEAVKSGIKRCVTEMGRLHVLVACAGVMSGSPVTTMSDQAWHRVIDVHLTGSFNLVRAAAPHLGLNGRIVLVSSIAARGLTGHANYAAAKAGIAGLTRALAIELGPQGVAVNAVAPGFIDTPMTRTGIAHHGVSWDHYVLEYAAGFALRRIGTPEDVAGVIAFLASEDAAYVTGQVIYVNGSP